MQKSVIGYVWGYKTTSTEDRDGGKSARVSFVSGTSDKYPKKYQNEKDFWVETIQEGDFSAVYVGLDDVIKAYKEAMANTVKYRQAYEESFAQRQHYFVVAITLDQYLALGAWTEAQTYLNCKRYESEEDWQSMFNHIVGPFFDPAVDLQDIYNSFVDGMALAYDESVEKALGPIKASTAPSP
jgi:hypothetical protein